MYKRIISLALILTMLCGLAACGKDDDPTENSTLQPSETVSTGSNPSTGTTPSESSPTVPSSEGTLPSAPVGSTPTEPSSVPTQPTEPDHTHSYTKKVTAPTCTEKGYITYTCACGDTYKDDETAAKGHSWSDWKTTKEPTEAAEGEAARSCSRCSAKETKKLASLNHTHSYSKQVTAPTCTEKGHTTYTCACGNTYKDDETAAKGHSWSDWKTTKEPTEAAEGEAARSCSRCSAKETKKLDKLAHTHVYTETVTPPTYTEPGYTTYTCACGHSYKGNETPPAVDPVKALEEDLIRHIRAYMYGNIFAYYATPDDNLYGDDFSTLSPNFVARFLAYVPEMQEYYAETAEGTQYAIPLEAANACAYDVLGYTYDFAGMEAILGNMEGTYFDSQSNCVICYWGYGGMQLGQYELVFYKETSPNVYICDFAEIDPESGDICDERTMILQKNSNGSWRIIDFAA